MKCIHCLLCLTIIRLDEKIFYYCDLCRRVYRRENYKPVELPEEEAREIEYIYIRKKKESQNVS